MRQSISAGQRSRHERQAYNIDVPKAAFTTLGCKVNQYETQKILEDFENSGFEIVPFQSEADVYVINTCSVTSIAESKSRYTIRKASRTNPDAKIVVTGCAAQMAQNTGETLDGAHLIVDNPVKHTTFSVFADRFPEYIPKATPDHTATKPFAGRTRAVIKIQDGCDVLCSYCSIPFTRPGMTSRPATEILKEAQTLAEQGYKEAILTGVLIGAYGPETGSGGPSFEDLVRLLDRESGLARIRISSIEMHQVTESIVELAATGSVAPHFHIPLQAGDSQVLADMNRRYDQDAFLNLCASLYKSIPDLTLTTDILVGFPTETEERFQSSVHVCKEAKFAKAHVFRFSPRPGTPADRFGDPISPQEKQERSRILNEVTTATAEQHSKKFVGRTMRVLVEKQGKHGLLEGLTDNYLDVRFPGPQALVKNLCQVNLQQTQGKAMIGELASEDRMQGLRSNRLELRS